MRVSCASHARHMREVDEKALTTFAARRARGTTTRTGRRSTGSGLVHAHLSCNTVSMRHARVS